MSARILSVPLGSKSYEIEIGHGNLGHIGPFLSDFKPLSLAVILTDRNVFAHGYATRVAEMLSNYDIDSNILSIEAGEQSKIIEMAATLWKTLLQDGVDRKAVLISVGGGVVGDLGGFVAATWSRGIRFFQVPTTLLAQVDSSVGGKVGIDLPGAKNMVGAFHQPIGVLIDTSVLDTLPENQYRCGLGEVVKYGLSLDADLLTFLEEHVSQIKHRDHDVLERIVADCCRIKASIVAEDEFETTGKRILLNYGHTFAHAFEILTDFEMLHGQAVAAGAICAAKLARKLGLIDQALLERHIALLQALDLLTEMPGEIDAAKIIELMSRDKKTEFGHLRFVLPTGPGECRVVDDVPQEQIVALLQSLE